jgi:hypothetical protein
VEPLQQLWTIFVTWVEFVDASGARLVKVGPEQEKDKAERTLNEYSEEGSII